MRGGVVIVEVLMYGPDEQSEIRDDHPALGEEIVRARQRGDVTGEPPRIPRYVIVGERNDQ